MTVFLLFCLYNGFIPKIYVSSLYTYGKWYKVPKGAPPVGTPSQEQ